ncbi:response regulator [Lusitaniella coriacea LEGE 07157]|uniref:Response regulator n=1 Tax=Lusitaniella coriacea LEGE 07157 TaxID=945747 RepID=A0A8J7E2L3_9CYAN|nr:response regulator [Lusitaniella coriacea]MBE9117659.1 response regulator [Lusitaniella coriacea LEGE 07157]
MRLLLVEDDELLAQDLRTALSEQNYVVDIANDGEEGWDYAQSFTYDLMLLDVSLPKLDGIDLCRRLRNERYNNPILLLTAKDASEHKVMGLDAGADDYVVKPCTIPELFARIRALLRRRSDSGAPILCWGELQLEPSSREVTYRDKSLNLSPTEYRLLELFMRNPKRVFSKSAILEHLWSFDDPPNEDTIRAHIKGLRRRIKAAKAEDVIETVYGVGYRLKPLPEHKPQKQEQTLAAVAQAWERFKKPTLERLGAVEDAIAAWKGETLTEDARALAEQQAHKLAGSLGMYGFTEASHFARDLELGLEKLKERDRTQVSDLQTLATRLRQELEQPRNESQSLEGEVTQTSIALHPGNRLESSPLLLVVDDDRVLTKAIQSEASHRNLRIKVADTIAHARMAIEREVPNIILLDLTFSNESSEGISLLKELKEHHPTIPVLVFTLRDGFSDRVNVARLGGKAFLVKPMKPAQILEAVADVLKYSCPPEATVLAVDDDPMLLSGLEQFLAPWGVKLQTLEDPREFWETLEASPPDLLILDVDMPHINGIELCKVVRNDSTWHQLPILFLSAKRDRETVHRIYEAGADDYISKPVTEPELVTRIFNRLERTRLLRSLAETDPLTGVANRSRAERELDRYLRLAQRYDRPLCLALLDLDGFKAINDRYGHSTGDRVLQRIGQLLRMTFKSEDIVSRWGGAEFVIGMYGFDRNEGIQRLEELLEIVRNEVFPIAGQEKPLQVTISAGVAEYPKQGSDLQALYQTADAALTRAKIQGRDRAALSFEDS